MTNREVLQLNRAFELLENQPENGVLKPTGYKFGKGTAAIVRNLRLLDPVVTELEKVREALLKPLLEQVKARKTKEEAEFITGLDVSEPEYKEFMDTWKPILDETSSFEPYVFDQKLLNFEKNDILPSLVKALTPVLKDD